MNKSQEVIGARFGKLVVLEVIGSNSQYRKIVRVRCDCGTEKTVLLGHLKTCHTTSCGCNHRQGLADINRSRKGKPGWATHGETRGRTRTAEYRCWVNMRCRCYDPKDKAWKNYGGRGIKVCDRWLESYENFLADVGRKPSPEYSIDRINNDGDYEPGNVHWATEAEQRLNKRPHSAETRKKLSAATKAHYERQRAGGAV